MLKAVEKRESSIFAESTISLSKLENIIRDLNLPIPSRSKLQRLIMGGELKGRKVGNRFLVTKESLFKWLLRTGQVLRMDQYNLQTYLLGTLYLTPKDITNILKKLELIISRQSILRAIHNGKIEACFDGNRYLVWEYSLYQYICDNYCSTEEQIENLLNFEKKRRKEFPLIENKAYLELWKFQIDQYNRKISKAGSTFMSISRQTY